MWTVESNSTNSAYYTAKVNLTTLWTTSTAGDTMTGRTHPNKRAINVAIIGAGVSSLCLARGLLQHGSLRVRVFEARQEIGHDGSGFGIAGNGQNAMSLIDPELLACLGRAGGVKNVPHLKLMMGNGPNIGETITKIHANPPQITVRRSRLLTELKNSLPDGLIELGKRLVAIERSSNEEEGILVTFEDGTAFSANAVIGAEGINSIIRREILGIAETVTESKWRPGFNTRIVIPMTQAVAIFGEEYCRQPTQIGWIGQGGFCLTDFEDNGEAMQVIASFHGEKPVAEVFGKPFVEVDKDFWMSRVEGWGWIGDKISKVVESQDKVYAASVRYHDETPTYCDGRLCIAGDAAGSFSPALGAGASQGIEDAMILYAVLGCARGPEDVKKSFQVYDSIRRPRRAWVAIESNRQVVKITGRMDGVGLDMEKLAKAVQEPYEQLYGYNLEGSIEEAKKQMYANGDDS